MPTFNLAWITWVSCTTVRPSNMSHWRVDVPTTTITSLGQLVGFVRWSSVLRRRLEQSVQYSLVCLLVQFSVVGKGAYLCLLLRVLPAGFIAASSSEEQLLWNQSMLRWRSILISVGVRPEPVRCRILSHQNLTLQRAGKGNITHADRLGRLSATISP